jgi:REP element-mobilizing transposase RayT
MSELIRKQHNVSILLYHNTEEPFLRRMWMRNSKKYAPRLNCATRLSRRTIGTDGDHVHFLVQSVPSYSPTKIVRTIKSITAKEIFRQMPEVKKKMWGGEFWSDGYFISTVGSHGTEEMLKQYVKNQGKSKDSNQLRLF